MIVRQTDPLFNKCWDKCDKDGNKFSKKLSFIPTSPMGHFVENATISKSTMFKN